MGLIRCLITNRNLNKFHEINNLYDNPSKTPSNNDQIQGEKSRRQFGIETENPVLPFNQFTECTIILRCIIYMTFFKVQLINGS